MSDETKFTVEEAHLHFAKKINGKVWELLGQDRRTKAENDEMLYAAHACTYHWLQVGTPVHQQRGEWLISHVYVALGNSLQALIHAESCFELTNAHNGEMKDFDVAYAYEGLARANALAGKVEEAKNWYAMAQRAGKAIVDEEDRDIFMGDFENGNWYDLK
jgi:hypothetical protein